MTSETNNKGRPGGFSPDPARTGASRQSGEPGWANGLKQLYDAVVDEDIPDAFKDLLSQLDKNEKG